MTPEFRISVHTAFGLEAVAGRELRQLGYKDYKTENGKLSFTGGPEAIARCNLWLRTAERVRIEVGSFRAETFDELFEGTYTLPWEEIIPAEGAFPVEGKSVKSTLFSVSDCQAIVKKAVAKRLAGKYGTEWMKETGSFYRIEVSLLKDVAVLSIDTSGTGLHKRGYREGTGEAPLKETLAAGLVLLSDYRYDRILADPFCGSGTIPIEAAMIGQNKAPGLGRDFAAENWDIIPESIWGRAEEEALDLWNRKEGLAISGTDIDRQVIKKARRNAEKAGVAGSIHFQERDYREWSSPKKYGIIITNPPYGERLGDRKAAEQIYRGLGKMMKGYPSWSFYLLTSHKEFEYLFGRKSSKRRKLYNGTLEVQYYQYYGPRPPRGNR